MKISENLLVLAFFLVMICVSAAASAQEVGAPDVLYMIDTNGDHELDLSTNDPDKYKDAEERGLDRHIICKDERGKPFEYPTGSGLLYTFKRSEPITSAKKK
jgi:hypothetical protein